MFDKDELLKELTFKAVRSSGAGGQNVNKVASKVELIFNLNDSSVLDETQKERLQNKLKNRLTNDGFIILQCDENRSQHKNKERVIKRFFELLETGLFIPKKRIPTKIPSSVIKKRLKSKRNIADKKANRKNPDTD